MTRTRGSRPCLSSSFPLLALAALQVCSPSPMTPRAAAQSWAVPGSREIAPGFQYPGYDPGELLVKFKETVPRDQMERAAREQGATLVEVVTPDGLAKIRLKSGVTVSRVIASWSRRPDVDYAAPNFRARGFFVPNDTVIHIPNLDLAWNLTNLQAFAAWDVARGDPSVVLGIVDTGVAFEDYPIPPYELPYVKPGVTMYRQSPDLPGPFLSGYDFVHDDAHPDDDNGHGTQVATIAAGLANNIAGSAGLAFGVTILPVKVIDYRNDAETDDIVQGIRFAADQGADIINLSLGYPPLDIFQGLLGLSRKEIIDFFRPLKDAIQYAQRRGAIIVAAAGNFDAPEVSLPAGYPGVLAIGAATVDNSRSSYSSYGLDLDFMAPGGDFGDLNGDHVQDQLFNLSIKPNRSEGSLANPDSFGVFPFVGTSAACAEASGAVALLMSQGVRSQGSLEQVLRATSIRPFGKPVGFSPEYGNGFIQLEAAVLRNAAPRGADLAVGSTGGFEARLVSRNPARGEAIVSLRTARSGRITGRIFDVRGALVRTVMDAALPAGSRVLRWDGLRNDGSAASSGIYFFTIETAEGRSTYKVAFLR